MPDSKLHIQPATKLNQNRASNPKASAFVTANAGSGKTYVLAQRVTRLLLAGNQPSRILCLTFTKAAAAEMSNRVFRDLRRWAKLSDEELFQELADIEGLEPGQMPGRATLLQRARRLFAEALETPGGLKIQTIHAFCESLLHQFPLEANISSHFEVMDDPVRENLVEQSRALVIGRASDNPDSEEGVALTTIQAITSEHGFDKGLDSLIAKRHVFQNWIPDRQSIEPALQNLYARLDMVVGQTHAALIADHFPLQDFTAAVLAEFAQLASRGGKQDQEQADRIQSFVEAETPEEQLIWLGEICLTKSGSPRSKIANKPVTDTMSHLPELFEREVERLLALKGRLATLTALQATDALVRIGHRVLANVELQKQRQSLLDFDDLVAKTAHLLTRADASKWVQYKLDMGIDHILVDEAQDTSPQQWQIIRALVEEYFAGEGARGGLRTIFAVGDEKQSIYSFQGAEPQALATQRRAIRSLAEEAGQVFETVPLHQSFRSTLDVLKAVDVVFEDPDHHKGLSFDEAGSGGEAPQHETARENAPGEVEIWPMMVAKQVDEPEDWTAPVDQLSAASAEFLLADRMAKTIADWLQTNNVLRSTGEIIEAGDIMILVRKRGAFMAQIIRELKKRHVPVAGMDRFQLTSHIAVQDLMALGRFVLLSEDDLSLAALMKSPLLGLSEDDLYDISRGKNGAGRGDVSLFQAFREKIAGGPTAAQKLAFEKLTKWRNLADQVSVFEFYSSVLQGEGGRAAMLARLGLEAEDVIDSFLDKCLGREGLGVPGLDGFLSWLETSDPEVKREMDEARGQVRVMTTHGSKGLEAPVVFLVDPGNGPTATNQASPLVKVSSEVPGFSDALLWQPAKQERAPHAKVEEEKRKDLAAEEYRRLLYVGMTRAADRLILCGYRNKTFDEKSWQAMAKSALVDSGSSQPVEEVRDDAGNVESWRWCLDPAEIAAKGNVDSKDVKASDGFPDLPQSLKLAPQAETRVEERLSPSSAQTILDELADVTGIGGRQGEAEKALSPVLDANGDNIAMQRGSLIHRLFEGLPGMVPSERETALDDYLAVNAKDYPHSDLQSIRSQVLAVFNDPQSGRLFGAGSRAEVPVTGELLTESGSRIVSGQIDRLHVDKNTVTIIDFKTNRLVPEKVEDCPQGYITQMAIYRQLLSHIYPDREIVAVLIWTQGPKTMAIPAFILDQQINKLLGSNSRD